MTKNTFDPHGPDELTTGEINGQDPASELIRQKLEAIYAEEPDAREELKESEQLPKRSKHQEFMYKLGTSGKDLATVQTEWHQYYQSLTDEEKKTVWQEFYASQSLVTNKTAETQAPRKRTQPAKTQHRSSKPKLLDSRSATEVQAAIKDKVSAGGKLKTKHHLQSLFFGLAMGSIVLLVFLFGFFNEVVIAPFIQPARTSASTPLIVSSSDVAPTSRNEVIIPKINVQIPVIYDVGTTDENAIENSLEDGVVHYPTTSRPGEQGNAAFFGHSSNNIFNKGKYKFAFVLLHTMAEGDTFYLTYNGKVYVYKVISRTVVNPDQVGVLNPVPGETATATLITCDPPGTSLHRLVVVGRQISPDPANNIASSTQVNNDQATQSASSLPGNGPTLLGRLIGSVVGKILILSAILAVAITIIRRINKPNY